MIYRNIRVKGSEQWVNVLFTEASDEFTVPEESHVKDIAKWLELPPEALEAYDQNTDRREGELLQMPPAPDYADIEERDLARAKS